MNRFFARKARLTAWMDQNSIGAAMFEDAEGRRDPSIRYLSGQPGDSLLIVTAAGRSLLVSWDVNMAAIHGNADEILSYTDFERKPEKALAGVLAREGIKSGSKVELPSATRYPSFLRYAEALKGYDLVCREEGASDFLLGMRALKDSDETALYREAAAHTDSLMELVEKAVRSGKISSEIDAALMIEREAHGLGCEGTGFETLCAGPSRSFGIHCFPAFTSGEFGARGLSILDFGLKAGGYTTDVTMSFVCGPLDPDQEKMIGLVQAAYRKAVEACKPGVEAKSVARAVDGVFAEGGRSMPHALGHGIGLEAHEAPWIRSREDRAWRLEPGMVFTLEPGLYDPVLGGVRLENDFLMTGKGPEALTHSRIVFM